MRQHQMRFLVFLPLLFAQSAINGAVADQAESQRTVTVYCSVDADFAEPILKTFEDRTKIEVVRVFDTEAGKTTGLVNRLLAEKRRPRADVWWSGELFGSMQLASQGILAPHEPKTAGDIPQIFRDPSGLWTATGLRGRVIAYNPTRIKPEDLPRRWADLSDPKYKGRFRMADPRFGTTRGHMATLLSIWGRPAMEQFYRDLRTNECKIVDGNAQAVLHLTRGLADLVATDTDDVLSARRRGEQVEMVYPDLTSPDGKTNVEGTLWIPSSAALVAGAPHPDAGRALVDYLVSAEVETLLHKSDSGNIPVRPALRTSLKAEAPRQADVDYAAAARLLSESDRLVREVLLP